MQEARSLLKARKLGVAAPVLYHVDAAAACLYMEYVAGALVKDRLFAGLDDQGALTRRGSQLPPAICCSPKPSLSCVACAALRALAVKIGHAVAKLHDGGMVHGDLTTSNMIERDSDGVLVLIDFGLAVNATLAEDKAVDLYVLERAITSAHSQYTALVRATSCRWF